MLRIVRLTICFFFLSTLSAPAAMYSWTDESGVKHFSNFVPPDAIDSKTMAEEKYRKPAGKVNQKAALNILTAMATDKPAGASEKGHTVYDKELFMDKVRGKTPERVYKLLKRTPDRRDGRKTWVYHNIVNNPTVRRVESVIIKFERGRGKRTATDFTFFVNKKS